MSQKYPSINIPSSIWKYENGWKDVQDQDQKPFKLDSNTENFIKTLVKDDLEEGEILEKELRLVDYSDSDISDSEISDSEDLSLNINRYHIVEEQLKNTKKLLEQSNKTQNQLKKELIDTKKLLEQSNQGNTNELTNVAAAWHQYSYQLECEINRKEQVIQSKDNKATRLINIIRDKNSELDEINNKYNTLSKSLDMIRQILNPGSKKPQLSKEFTDYMEFVRDKLYERFSYSFELNDKVADQNNKEKFKTFLYNTHKQYLEQDIFNLNFKFFESHNIKKLDKDDKKKVMENFMAYMKYIDSMTDSQVDYIGGGWNGTLEDLCNETVTTCFPYNASYNGW